MAIRIFLDHLANAIFVARGTVGTWPLNCLQAIEESDGTVSVRNKAKEYPDSSTFLEISHAAYTEFVDETDTAWGADGTEVTNNLNAIFAASGTSDGTAPTITSSLAVTLTEGQTLNYELTATGGVGYEWDLSSVPGITTVEGNGRKLIGGSGLAVGTYNIPVKAINYYGEDSQTLVLTVSSPPFSNTYSVNFEQSDWLGANAALLDAELGRASNGAGSGDAWTIHFWFKGGSYTSNSQTIFYFGDNDTTNAGHIQVRYRGGDNSMRFQYGSNNNYLRWVGGSNLLPVGTWKHVMITYDGGTTGASSGDINNYYSRFTIFVDGSDVTSGGSWSNGNYGYTASVDADNLRIARYDSGAYLRNSCRIDEFAVWGSDQSANIASIYNSGTVHDLSALGTAPDHWWRMGDGDTYPNIQDQIGTATFVMYNMTASEIVSDVP